MSRPQAVIAVSRFGLGARPGEIDAAAGDPRGWLASQLSGSAAALPAELAGVAPAAERAAALLAARAAGGDRELIRMLRQDARAAYIDDAIARIQAASRSPAPFVERLVRFWSNHFTVSAARPVVANLCGPFEKEAIRPHLFGRFEDMLAAVVRHPAMLMYLDNAVSVGPNSRAGQRSGRGLNENLARELLELHTVGVDGGYAQADVRQLALILTGWSIARPGEPNPGAFRYRPFIHEPGAKTLLSQSYPEAGEGEGRAALAALAQHPATARHVATKLARHFVADQPPAAAVERLARVFRDSGGDLRAVSAALITLDAAWADPLSKYRTPDDLVIATLRAVDAGAGWRGGENLVRPGAGPAPRTMARPGAGADAAGGDDAEAVRRAVQRPGGPALASLRMLGQLPWRAPSPAGWPDTAGDWASPEAVMQRIDWALAVARRIAGLTPPVALLDATLGPLASATTRTAVERAPSREDALALVLVSPEFQRR